jgi:glycosyltransferase involved in cell wall biosynthesis
MELSIITVNLNNKNGLLKTIESVVSQTYRNFEYLVIDGGSSDGSLQIIENFSVKIDYWISEPDKGIYSAMNKGILKSKGKYLLFLNSGDWLVNNNVLFDICRNKLHADIILCDMNLVSKNAIKLRKAISGNDLTLTYFFHNSICHPASLILRELFSDQLFDEEYRIAADKKFFINNILIKNCTVQNLTIAVCNFNTNGISSQPENMRIIKEENDKILKEIFPTRVLRDIMVYREISPEVKGLLNIKRSPFYNFLFNVIKKLASLLK